ncbi:DMT family transporter [Paenibacillus cremeus]|nr:DMT family transporter [Paenibacillus cremeus]
MAVLLVVISGLTHAVWNLFAKRSLNKEAFLWAILIPSEIILVPPFVQTFATTTELPWNAYALLGLSMLLQGIYGLLLTRAYRLGDLSQLYPIMRGTATLLVPVIGVSWLGESLSVWGWIGLCGMIVSFFILSGWSVQKKQAFSVQPLLVAFAVGLCTTSYVFVDKLNLQYWSPLNLLGASNLGFLLALTPRVIASKKQWIPEVRANWPIVLLGSALSPGSYFLFLLAMNLAPMAHISPIREIGTVFATFLGVVVLREKQGIRRIISSATIATAIVIISLFG